MPPSRKDMAGRIVNSCEYVNMGGLMCLVITTEKGMKAGFNGYYMGPETRVTVSAHGIFVKNAGKHQIGEMPVKHAKSHSVLHTTFEV